MKRGTALCITGLLAVSLAPEAFAWRAYHGEFGGANDHRAYHGGAYGYQGGTYNIGTTAVTPGYMGWGAASAGAAVGAPTAVAATAATVNAYATSTSNYDPAPYYSPYGY